MNIEQIEAEWAKDSDLDITDLAAETRKTVKLHSKYYRLYRQSAAYTEKHKQLRAKLIRLKTEYYLGELDKETLDKRGWKPFQKRLLKTELPSYLASDDDMIECDLKLSELNTITEFLESIIKSINNRGHHIRNVIEFLKFKNGGY